tara:strand:+ start:752 stop:973 length:222 start_codon:yes stop_codon:yes gene_type:complete
LLALMLSLMLPEELLMPPEIMWAVKSISLAKPLVAQVRVYSRILWVQQVLQLKQLRWPLLTLSTLQLSTRRLA